MVVKVNLNGPKLQSIRPLSETIIIIINFSEKQNNYHYYWLPT